MRAVLLDGAEALHRDVYRDGLVQLGDKDTALLEVGLAADLASGVKLRRAGAVGVPPPNLSRFPRNVTFSCHKYVAACPVAKPQV